MSTSAPSTIRFAVYHSSSDLRPDSDRALHQNNLVSQAASVAFSDSNRIALPGSSLDSTADHIRIQGTYNRRKHVECNDLAVSPEMIEENAVDLMQAAADHLLKGIQAEPQGTFMNRMRVFFDQSFYREDSDGDLKTQESFFRTSTEAVFNPPYVEPPHLP